ncbi:sensor histidine kinase [Micromonospora sp. WMMD1120]|uniref:sensor histidine kinase n=1 Tax=Micromonospora sp. WMMD1120 TaxID=3016106 RepID=UPI00241636BD|nr:sensor histidine kinase [Micromonospora sp. WMMD1120]MDG4808104.1 sensor histidine kinase [Micromonospora sp. WMMD1120]
MIAHLLSRRLRPKDLYVLDAVLAVAVGGFLCPYAALESPLHGGVREPLWLSVLVGMALGLPLAARRRWPVPVAVLISVIAAAALAAGVIPNFAAAAPALAIGLSFYTVAVSTTTRRSMLSAAGCLALVSVALVLTAGDLWSRTGAVAYALVMIAPAWLIGWSIRERRALAARQSDHLVRQAATEERLRVARELHDVVAHTLSLIVVKAAVANHVAEADPREAGAALRVIEETGRGALTDVRRVLGVLRDGAPYAPTPGLDELSSLAEQAAIGGVEVRLDVRREEPAGTVPESVGLAVYRIVQEAVTNVVKHAAPAACRATVTVLPTEVRVEVTDDGRRPVSTVGEGHGLTGMRERVALHGGEFRAGPRNDGGFAVTARLPYRVAA